MNPKTKYTSLFAALSLLLLPIGANAESGTSTSSNSNTSGSSGQYQGSSTGSQQQSSTFAQADRQNFKRVSEDKLDDKVTADRLMGKKVVDRDGKTVGKVKDIGLTQALRDSSEGNRSGHTATASVGGVSASGSIGQTGSSSNSSQVNLYIELEDDVGLDGDDLASIPASSVRFDKDKDELKLQINRQELATNLRQSANLSASE